MLTPSACLGHCCQGLEINLEAEHSLTPFKGNATVNMSYFFAKLVIHFLNNSSRNVISQEQGSWGSWSAPDLRLALELEETLQLLFEFYTWMMFLLASTIKAAAQSQSLAKQRSMKLFFFPLEYSQYSS